MPAGLGAATRPVSPAEPGPACACVPSPPPTPLWSLLTCRAAKFAKDATEPVTVPGLHYRIDLAVFSGNQYFIRQRQRRRRRAAAHSCRASVQGRTRTRSSADGCALRNVKCLSSKPSKPGPVFSGPGSRTSLIEGNSLAAFFLLIWSCLCSLWHSVFGCWVNAVI